MFEEILNLLKGIWDKLKKTFVAIVDFVKNIGNWFKVKYNEVIKKKPKAIPIALKIKKNIETRNYRTVDLGLKHEHVVVKTFYDEATGEILEDDTEVIESNQLDEKTIRAFGDKDMLVLE